MAEKKVKFAFFIWGIITIFLFGIYWWFTKTFGNINILQILWHIENAHTLKHFDSDIIRHFLQFIGLSFLACILWFFVLYRRQTIQNIYIYITSKLHALFIKFLSSKKIDIILYLIVIVSFSYILNNAYHKFSLHDLVKIKFQEYSEESDFILQNYKAPDIENVKFEKKNNLIVILLESITTNLRVNDEKISYIPQMESLYTEYQHHENLKNCIGTDWTIGALTAWAFGLPLKLPSFIDGNQYNVGSFLPNAVSVFDILKKNGYANYLVLGSSAHFSGMKYLFKHGSFTINDSKYFEAQDKINEENQSEWGVRDYFLYDEVYAKYLDLRKQNDPFVLFIQTVDTHFPGYASENKRKYGDIRDSWLEADRLLYDFIKKMKPYLETDNVSILIFGDHCPMGEFITLNRGSSLFNLFAGKNVPQIPASKLAQKINPMDIAPTILQAAGAKWDNNQFGLGISIFSEDKSFSEIEGLEALDEKLLYYSKFYDKFF